MGDLMKKLSKSFLRECKRFDECNTVRSPGESENGLRQFHDYESKGVRPEQPDPYFTHLLNGKAWWEWTLNYYAEMFYKGEWPGWFMLAQDFKDDPEGFRQLRQRCGFSPLTPAEMLGEIEDNDKKMTERMSAPIVVVG